MSLPELILATRNQDKLTELVKLFADRELSKVKSALEVEGLAEVEETGSSLAENAPTPGTCSRTPGTTAPASAAPAQTRRPGLASGGSQTTPASSPSQAFARARSSYLSALSRDPNAYWRMSTAR